MKKNGSDTRNNLSITLGKRQLVDSIWKSTGIEGLGTTFPATEAILENLPVLTTRDEVYFVCNLKRAWEFVFENVDYPTSLSLLRQLNAIAMENLAYGAGDLRTVPVSIGGTSWKPEMPHQGTVLEDLVKICENPDKIEVALDLFCYVCRKQMFIDGNKRVAQLVANKVLMEADKGILSIPYDRIQDFKVKLVEFYESGDPSKLKEFLREECLTLVTQKSERDLNGEEQEESEREV